MQDPLISHALAAALIFCSASISSADQVTNGFEINALGWNGVELHSTFWNSLHVRERSLGASGLRSHAKFKGGGMDDSAFHAHVDDKRHDDPPLELRADNGRLVLRLQNATD